MTYAILDENFVVTNIAEASHQVDSNWAIVPIGANVEIGDSFVNGLFYNQDGDVRLAADTKVLADAIESLFKGIQEA